MPENDGPHKPTQSPKSALAFLECLPVAARYAFYTAFFLSVLLIALPWVAYRIDLYLPRLHIEAGLVVRSLGVLVFIAFLIAYLASSRLLTSRGHGGHVEFDPPRDFVATGIYRWVRNPIAGSAVMMLLGEALAFSSTGILILFLAAMVFAHLQVILLEEPLLRKRFGASYTDYLARVPRWIPRRPRGSD